MLIPILIGSLAILAGFIAHAGDRLGSYFGKQRLSLLGLRPKRTGQFFGVLAGVLIMLITLGLSALTFRQATSVILGAEAAVQERDRALAETQRMNEQISTLENRLALMQDELLLASADREEALAESARLEASVEALRLEKAQLQQEKDDASLELAAANQQLANQTRLLADVQAERSSNQESLKLIEQELAERLTEIEQAQIERRLMVNEVVKLNNERITLTQQNTQALLDRQRLLQTNIALYDQRDTLEQRNQDLHATNNDLADVNEQLLLTQRNLSAVNDSLRADNTNLQLSIENLNNYVEMLNAQSAVLKIELDYKVNELSLAREQLVAISQRALSYENGELIYVDILLGGGGETGVLEQVSEMVSRASKLTALRGGGEVTLSTKQAEELVAALGEEIGEFVVSFRSPHNQFMNAPIEVVVDVAPNAQLAEVGQLLASRSMFIHENLSPEDIRSEINGLYLSAQQTLSNIGTMASTNLSATDMNHMLEWIADRQGELVLGIVNSDPVYVAGEVPLEVILLR